MSIDRRTCGLVDLYFRWLGQGDTEAAAVLGDALEERGYDVIAERIAKARGARRIGVRAYDHLRFDAANILLQIAGTGRSGRHAWVAVDMIRGIEDGIWLSAWASAMEETGRNDEVPRHITRGTAPEVPITGREHARRYALKLICENRATLEELWQRASEADGQDVDAEALGYDLAMQGQGHGVSWFDDHAEFPIEIPRAEWYVSAGRGARWGVEGYP